MHANEQTTNHAARHPHTYTQLHVRNQVSFSGWGGRGTAFPSWRAEQGTEDERKRGRLEVCAGCVQGVWRVKRGGSELRAGWRPAEECGCCYSTSLGPTTPTGANWRYKQTKRQEQKEAGRKRRHVKMEQNTSDICLGKHCSSQQTPEGCDTYKGPPSKPHVDLIRDCCHWELPT